ncbi:GrpB family protein [Halopelagius longus]|uniref:GrpB family protein n=1 Tax=Halopelagius longus TaxID=1236180 RepID=UPI0015F0467E|nr:GrpB family protein [Halopelagius longus]
MKDRNVTFESDPYWPERYEDERERLLEVAGDRLLGVFHVGSTAIRDLPGKPALDIVAVYTDEESVQTAAEKLDEREGYERESDSTVVRWEDEYAVFVKLHAQDDQRVRNQLVFREYLRENPDARNEYERIKRTALEEHPEDLETYTKAKSEVVASILERARKEGYEERLPGFV